MYNCTHTRDSTFLIGHHQIQRARKTRKKIRHKLKKSVTFNAQQRQESRYIKWHEARFFCTTLETTKIHFCSAKLLFLSQFYTNFMNTGEISHTFYQKS